MTHQIDTPTENLSLGMAAARSGRLEEARRYLASVLVQAPENTTAMCWLAFVAASPQQSVAWLERVLALEPDNRRAKAGLKWAEQRLAQVPAKPQLSEPIVEPAVGRQGRRARLPAPVATASPKITPRRRAKRWLKFTVTVAIMGCIAGAALSGWLYDLASFLAAQTETIGQSEPLRAGQLVPVEPSPSALILTGVTVKYLDLSETGASFPEEVVAKSRSAYVEAVDIAAETRESTTGQSSSAPAFQPQRRTASVEASLQAVPGQMVEAISLGAVENPALRLTPVANSLADAGEAVVPAEMVMNGVRLFAPVAESRLVHQPASVDEKWIEVDLAAQRVTAWEGNVPVMSFLASTGLPETPTVLGKFNIYWKLESTLMTGPDYYLPEVPYTMYFYGGYGLHGAYWHSNFGQPMSHGCVNLSLADSKALFEWADPVIPPGQTQVVASGHNPGTLVIVHASS